MYQQKIVSVNLLGIPVSTYIFLIVLYNVILYWLPQLCSVISDFNSYYQSERVQVHELYILI